MTFLFYLTYLFSTLLINSSMWLVLPQFDFDFASVVAPGLTLRRSDTDWTWTLRLSSHWSTRLSIIDLIFLGSNYKNDSTLHVSFIYFSSWSFYSMLAYILIFTDILTNRFFTLQFMQMSVFFFWSVNFISEYSHMDTYFTLLAGHDT